MWKRRLCTSLVPYNPYYNTNSLFGVGIGIFITASSGVFAMFTVFATKEDLNSGINRIEKKIDDSNEVLRREINQKIESGNQLLLEKMENMLLKNKR